MITCTVHATMYLCIVSIHIVLRHEAMQVEKMTTCQLLYKAEEISSNNESFNFHLQLLYTCNVANWGCFNCTGNIVHTSE